MPWVGVQWEMAVGCGGLKGSRADWLVEKCTELGARSLRPILCERSSVVGALPHFHDVITLLRMRLI